MMTTNLESKVLTIIEPFIVAEKKMITFLLTNGQPNYPICSRPTGCSPISGRRGIPLGGRTHEIIIGTHGAHGIDAHMAYIAQMGLPLAHVAHTASYGTHGINISAHMAQIAHM